MRDALEDENGNRRPLGQEDWGRGEIFRRYKGARIAASRVHRCRLRNQS